MKQESDLKFIQKESLNKEVFTICKSGKRSEKASRILSQFKIQSRSIEGGIEKVKKYCAINFLRIVSNLHLFSNQLPHLHNAYDKPFQSKHQLVQSMKVHFYTSQ